MYFACAERIVIFDIQLCGYLVDQIYYFYGEYSKVYYYTTIYSMSLFLYHYSVEQFCGVYCSCLIKSFFIQWSMSLLHNSFLSTASGNHHSMFSFWELTFIDCILSEVREHYSCCTWLLLGNFISHGFKIYGKWHFYVLWSWMLLCYV